MLDDGRLVAEGTADELKRPIPGGHVRLRFTDAGPARRGRRALREVHRDDEALALQIPSDGSVDAARPPRPARSAWIEVDELTVHTPDLDDVFFALTGQPDVTHQPRRSPTSERGPTLAVRDSATMLRRNLRHARRYPSSP